MSYQFIRLEDHEGHAVLLPISYIVKVVGYGGEGSRIWIDRRGLEAGWAEVRVRETVDEILQQLQ